MSQNGLNILRSACQTLLKGFLDKTAQSLSNASLIFNYSNSSYLTSQHGLVIQGIEESSWLCYLSSLGAVKDSTLMVLYRVPQRELAGKRRI